MATFNDLVSKINKIKLVHPIDAMELFHVEIVKDESNYKTAEINVFSDEFNEYINLLTIEYFGNELWIVVKQEPFGSLNNSEIFEAMWDDFDIDELWHKQYFALHNWLDTTWCSSEDFKRIDPTSDVFHEFCLYVIDTIIETLKMYSESLHDIVDEAKMIVKKFWYDNIKSDKIVNLKGQE